MVKSSKEQIEADEIKILKELRKNSRLSYNDLAEKCGFSRQKVWRLVNDLEKNKTIWGYSTVIDEEKLGLKQFFLFIKRKGGIPNKTQIDNTINRSLKDHLKQLGITVEASYYTHGTYDWINIITGKNVREVKKFIEHVREHYQNIISDIQVTEVLFTLEKEAIENPKKDKLREFFD
jgi:Lrp/AsnC family leucine-responsive transcriptional regulator